MSDSLFPWLEPHIFLFFPLALLNLETVSRSFLGECLCLLHCYMTSTYKSACHLVAAKEMKVKHTNQQMKLFEGFSEEITL